MTARWSPLYRMYECQDGVMRSSRELAELEAAGVAVVRQGVREPDGQAELRDS